MKITFCFDREKPFGNAHDGETPDALLAGYVSEVGTAFRDRFPDFEIDVVTLDDVPGDVEFDPPDAFSDDERLEIALELRRIAHRLAETMLAAHMRQQADEPDGQTP